MQLLWLPDWSKEFENLRQAAISKRDCQKVMGLLFNYTSKFSRPKMACMIRLLLFEAENFGNKDVTDSLYYFLESNTKFPIDSIVNREKYLAVFNGNVELVDFFLKSATVKETTENTLGHEAAVPSRFRYGKPEDPSCDLQLLVGCLFYKKNNILTRKEILTLFIQNGLVDDYSEEFGHNLLHRYILLSEKDCRQAVEIAELLLDSGIPLHERDSDNFCPLDYAVLKENIPLISFFLNRGADINQSRVLGPPLHLATKFSQSEDLVDFLLSKHVNINYQDEVGSSALHEACLNSSLGVIILLIRRGANILAENKFENTPFFEMYDHESDHDPVNIEVFNKYFFEGEFPSAGIKIYLIKEYSKLLWRNISVPQKDIKLMERLAGGDLVNCVEEVAEMEVTKFHASHTLYSLLNRTIDIKKLAPLTNNEDLALYFHTISQKFIYYQEDLELVWEEAVEARRKLEATVVALYDIFNDFLPDVVIRKLAVNLTFKEEE